MTTLTSSQHAVVLAKAYNNQEAGTDFVISFTDGTIKLYVHKFILCLASDYFKTCINSGMMETYTNELQLEDDPTLVSNLVKSIYTGELYVPFVSDIVPMIHLCSKYMLYEQRGILLTHLEQNVNQCNVFDCLSLEGVENNNIKIKAHNYLRYNALEVLNGESILELEYESLTQALSSLVTDFSYIVCAFRTIERWVKKYDNRQEHLVDLLSFVNAQAENIQSSTLNHSPIYRMKGIHPGKRYY
jgi:hypothetical protein